nr:bifunctional proline dehydrogenase/L-glutamate gamma-semialdehyde dehydrogenase PutA [Sterolibacterium sp.]
MTTATADQPSPLSALRTRLPALHRCGEAAALTALLPLVSLPDAARQQVSEHARQLITGIRARQPERSAVAALLHEYALSSTEGVALMCLAEALLRIPDDATVDRLIHDKLGSIDWSQHIPHNDQLFINAANWALMLTGRLIHLENHDITLAGAARNLLSHASDPLIRQAMRAAMRLLGTQFIMGRNIEEARQRAHADETQGWRHSYDMLGEAALGQADAQRYRSAYLTAITALGTQAHATTHPIPLAPGISIKLSALHPRYEALQRPRVMAELLPVVRELALAAKTQGIGLTLDAEESDRLELSLDIFEALAFEPLLTGWDGLGLAVQAYQKRAPAVLDWLAELARCSHRRLMVRLVKGAYWDSEIKLAQERGLTDYPVHTRKAATDLAWLACAAKLLDDPTAFYPQFATHNALSVAHVLMLAKQRGLPASAFEFQCLHGMGRALYEQLIAQHPVRIYAPVGSHADLLAYLVRRLLENGANTSFVHQLENGQTPIAQLLIDPLTLWHAPDQPTPIPRPEALYLQHTPHQHQHNMPRKNSAGLDLQDTATQQLLAQALTHTRQTCYRAAPTTTPTTTQETRQDGQDIRSPANCQDLIGEVFLTRPDDLEQALQQATQAARPWQATPVHRRAGHLERAAELLEQHTPELISLIVREGGRTLIDAASEVREAIDFCRYYAASARADFAQPRSLPGPTGESNQLSLHGRGVFACISPWNFPLAIFTGQVAAALVAGNTVIAKPAEQTPLTAAAALRLLHAAGIPQEVLHLLPGDGTTGAALVADPRIDGVAFTGSSATAQRIQHSLAARNTAAAGIVPLIAETGGLNVMIADSSALPEQLVRDVLSSAFNSAGQRC